MQDFAGPFTVNVVSSRFGTGQNWDSGVWEACRWRTAKMEPRESLTNDVDFAKWKWQMIVTRIDDDEMIVIIPTGPLCCPSPE